MPTPELSNLEARIIVAIDDVGWYADLWFPIVQRGMMDFAADNTEEEVHAALVGLIRRGLLVLGPLRKVLLVPEFTSCFSTAELPVDFGASLVDGGVPGTCLSPQIGQGWQSSGA